MAPALRFPPAWSPAFCPCSPCPSPMWPRGRPHMRPDALSIASARVVALTIAFVVAFAFRTTALSTYGFSDEINKVHAIEQYRAGHFVANAEHPMLMKLAMWGSVAAADGWNKVAPPDQRMSLETAIRLPNALAGAVMTLALYGVAELLFGSTCDCSQRSSGRSTSTPSPSTASARKTRCFCSSSWWQSGSTSAQNDRARSIQPRPALVHRQRCVVRPDAGIKVHAALPRHLCAVQHADGRQSRRQPAQHPPVLRRDGRRVSRGERRRALASDVALLPRLRGGRRAHAPRLLVRRDSSSSRTFLCRHSAFGRATTSSFSRPRSRCRAGGGSAGVIQLRRRRERGFVLLRVLLVFVLMPYSLMAAKFIRYTLPMLATLDLLAAVGLVAGIGWLLGKGWLSPVTRVTVAMLALAMSIVGLVTSPLSAAPYLSLFERCTSCRADGDVSRRELRLRRTRSRRRHRDGGCTVSGHRDRRGSCRVALPGKHHPLRSPRPLAVGGGHSVWAARCGSSRRTST